jgi:hypothetical protein
MLTLASFSAFFWTLAGIITLMLIFEDKFLALEEKYDEWRGNKKVKKSRRKERNNGNTKRYKGM